MDCFQVSLNVNRNASMHDMVKIYTLPYVLKESKNFKYWGHINKGLNFYPSPHFQIVMVLCLQLL